MPEVKTVTAGEVDFARLYAQFDLPILNQNCGDQCSPYNERGVPFCCDTRHAVPVAYTAEWKYLQNNTNLWHLWEPSNRRIFKDLHTSVPDGQLLIECLGHNYCQRNFRALTCRAFPFFPYITRDNKFIGISYYWQYEDRCWVISNLELISIDYLSQFVQSYDHLFAEYPAEQVNFHYHSMIMRRVFGRWRRAIPLLHRNGGLYKISPSNGRIRKIQIQNLPKFGPYKVAAALPFPGERYPGS